MIVKEVAPAGTAQVSVTSALPAAATRFVGASGIVLVEFAISSNPLIEALSLVFTSCRLIVPAASLIALNSCTLALKLPPATAKMSKFARI